MDGRNPPSPLKAARLARGWLQREVCKRIQEVCPGHGGRDCRLPAGRLSEWEHGTKPVSPPHAQVLCAVYGVSAEALGLVGVSAPAASPLQAARIARGWSQQEVCGRLRKLCPGHSGRCCGLPASRVSEFETGGKRPTLTHVEALCGVYGMGPEELGLITWRTPERRRQADREVRERIRREVLAELAQQALANQAMTAAYR